MSSYVAYYKNEKGLAKATFTPGIVVGGQEHIQVLFAGRTEPWNAAEKTLEGNVVNLDNAERQTEDPQGLPGAKPQGLGMATLQDNRQRHRARNAVPHGHRFRIRHVKQQQRIQCNKHLVLTALTSPLCVPCDLCGE